jgi:hypothetical protein
MGSGLASLNEWSLFAERNGVDLIKVIKAIKVRPTHSNMIFQMARSFSFTLHLEALRHRLT